MTASYKPSIATLEKALDEYKIKGEVQETRCERCDGVIQITRKSETVLTVKCKCGLYNDNLRGL